MQGDNSIHRREFLRRTSLAFAALKSGAGISLVLDPADAMVSSGPVQWAWRELAAALQEAGATVHRREHVEQAPPSEMCVIARGGGAMVPSGPESLAIYNSKVAGRRALVAAGSDPRGLTYALLEIADRVRHPGLGDPLQVAMQVTERPANAVRSVMRQFTSEPLDKPWFHDREMWPEYLNTLAAARFNRFHLGFGLGYDFLSNVADSYMLFLYPFLLAVPGYDVRATNLPDEERDRNLAMLRYISEQTAARGIGFELGIWMHGYQMANSPRAKNVIEGLNKDNHAAYCRDALTAVLKACPAISSVALRIHGESGIAEGSYDFWRTVFDGVKRCGRKVEIDLHAKGIDQTMIDNALATGMPVNASVKYWAEHLGMPYHQAAIRDLEMPVAGHTGAGLMTLSEGARVFTRYGYADLLKADRRYTVRHRIFSGTQRILLWGDPAAAAEYSRVFSFCGSTGADWMEPLTCRGRRGSGDPGNRLGYADASLATKWDWQKYAYWYRLVGRTMYSPTTDRSAWERLMPSAPLRDALASASRVLPTLTTAHLPSAACDGFWPEIYWNQPIVAQARQNPYGDSPAPRTFGNVSPLDPQLFSRINDFADELLKGPRAGKYSPIEVAQWLEDYAAAAETALKKAGAPDSADARRVTIDVQIQSALGRFFGAKLRSGVLYAIFAQSADRTALEESLKAYRAARAAWAGMKDSASAYAADLSCSDRFDERGQWNDRLGLVDEDIAQMEQKLPEAKVTENARVRAAIAEAIGRPKRDDAPCQHRPAANFQPGKALEISMAVGGDRKVKGVRMYYRRVDQSERFQSTAMEPHGKSFQAAIPAEYTKSPYSLQYYFEVTEPADKCWLSPGFTGSLLNQPYYVVAPHPESLTVRG